MFTGERGEISGESVVILGKEWLMVLEQVEGMDSEKRINVSQVGGGG